MNDDSNPTAHDQSAAPTLAGVPARLQEILPDKLLVLPLRMRPFFPAQSMPIVLEDELWRETIERVGNTPQRLVGLVYARHPLDQGAP